LNTFNWNSLQPHSLQALSADAAGPDAEANWGFDPLGAGGGGGFFFPRTGTAGELDTFLTYPGFLVAVVVGTSSKIPGDSRTGDDLVESLAGEDFVEMRRGSSMTEQ